jgi:formylglycine-generating enzyme required for sulfatase activity
MREARTLARVEHPNIVGVHHVGEEQGVSFIVMQFLEGESLADRLSREPMAPAEAARIARDVARGLAAAHRAGVVHRDLKPHNIILAPDGTPKVVDFGLAREVSGGLEITRTGEVLGSPLYMSPEQCTMKPVGPAADQYALGATFYHMLAGRAPYSADSLYEILDKHVKDAVPDARASRPDVPEPLSTVARRLMAKDPAQRYADMDAVVAALDAAISVGADRSTMRWLPIAAVLLIGAVFVVVLTPWRRAVQSAGASSSVPPPVPTPAPSPATTASVRPPDPPPPSPPPAPVVPGATRLDIAAGGATVTVEGPAGPVHEGEAKVLDVRPGTYTVTGRAGAQRRVAVVEVRDGETKRVNVDPREPVGRVRIESKPPGAAIELDGEPRGETPKTIEGLALGEHKLVLRLKDHAPLPRTLTLDRDAEEKVTVALAAMGRLVISARAGGRRVRISGLKVTVDEKIVDPRDDVALDPGPHTVRIEHAELRPYTANLRLEAGQRLAVPATLEAREEWNGMVYVPAGEFRCGEERRTVRLGAFWIDRHEVTQGAYAKTGAARPRAWSDGADDLPVRSLTWQQAADFAAAVGKRLPSSDEWERAARGTDGRTYPWGEAWDGARANTSEARRDRALPAAEIERDVSPAGCVGMAGNVREWTSTTAGVNGYAMRGGSYDDNHHFARLDKARAVAAIDTSATNGVRCAADFLRGLIED